MNSMRPHPFVERKRHDIDPCIDEWPASCLYYEPGLMDGHRTLSLLVEDTTYTDKDCPWYLAFTAVNNSNAVVTREIFVHERKPDSLFDLEPDECSLLVLHIRSDRNHFGTRTSNSVSLDERTWRRLLRHFDILPQFVDLLHNNNGGSFAYTSYNSSSRAEGNAEPDVRALHFGYKIGVSVRQEVAVYARLDLERNRRLILVMGSEACICYDGVTRLLTTRPCTHWLEVVQNIFLGVYNKIDATRTIIDFRTQLHESVTGYAELEFLTKPLGLDQLKFDRSLYVTSGMCRGIGYSCDRLRMNCLAFMQHLTEYQSIIAQDPGSAHLASSHAHNVTPLTLSRLKNIREGMLMIIEQTKHQHDQIMELCVRLLAQADVTKSLIMHRDTQLTLELTEATKRDSELMRGITTVTMVFLPATFVATFFSMVFFKVADESTGLLMVHDRIWIYPVVTVPMTMFIAAWYFAWSSGWLKRVIKRRLEASVKS